MTYAVFFDVLPKKGFTGAYFGMAAGLKPIVEKNPGFISVERFENLGQAGWYLSYSQWVDENALGSWRCQHDHHGAQVCGRNLVLEDYRLRVGSEQSSGSDKSCILALVGDFSAVQTATESATKSFVNAARLFKGVINPARGIALFDCDFDSALKAKASLANQKLFDFGFYEVQRDYGMFDRAQAPTAFA
ncbi:antibiotic biosynthesis monooxygenase [Polynucleobacter sp. AP-Sanab-80-C2]|uniref:antibiotic biosynthesis monooxygenase family protein n=1 Tax=Polynucleobacter sp. AP-Sanab-80-C2 TaxID=3108274 RepID=UPI002B237857|nr:antibiotic biosynthesis monooxygenase [Polynucleobacter sp. AP-Sanab-80-C2]MEA9600457.1 antibiotic biosynthesis monooxygenase [Polynucleobacter sp. AP-Sanab-80-C2]